MAQDVEAGGAADAAGGPGRARRGDPAGGDLADPDAAEGGTRQRLLWLTAAAGLAVDQVTKAVAAVAVEGHQPSHALGGAVTFTAFRNSGAAGSFAPHATLVFTLLALGVLAFVARTAGSVRSTGWAVGLGLVFAGAGGNLTDRLFRTPGFGRGAVLDFIQVGHSGIFNLADQCVTAGALTILVQTFRGVPMRARRPSPRVASGALPGGR
ncbi:signal peptidase II [Actinacidiphila yeochonensis]|uniref:signal peptidase II n=1 Tax=Actinacidiphila yeochonensis TaxID=89050 RepID=UPI00068F193B|nr:signal peptidase II [Actinacidiphila yeochonensis]